MEMKTRKYTKEQLVSYLQKHGSTITEAANIMGTNHRTLNRYLAQDVIPSEWLAKLYETLKDRKPVKKPPVTHVLTCACCGKTYTKVEGKDTLRYTNETGLKHAGATDIPKKGYHYTDMFGEKEKMYPICDACHKKSEKYERELNKERLKKVPAKRKEMVDKKTMKAKITTKKK